MKTLLSVILILTVTVSVSRAAEPSLPEESLVREGISAALRGAHFLTDRQNADGSWNAPVSTQKRIRMVLRILAQEDPALKNSAEKIPVNPVLSAERVPGTASAERYRNLFQLTVSFKQLESDSVVKMNFPAWKNKMLSSFLKFQNPDGSWGRESQIVSSGYALAAICLILQETFSGSDLLSLNSELSTP